jgi:hypothetical protein
MRKLVAARYAATSRRRLPDAAEQRTAAERGIVQFDYRGRPNPTHGNGALEVAACLEFPDEFQLIC